MKKTTLLRALIISGFFAALTFFSSCEVGLGSAVDTQAPQITIEKPEVDMVIRQKFVISGTWQDDGTIDKVYVKLSRTDKRPLDGKSTKELLVQGDFAVSPVTKEEGTWEVIIDPLNQDLQIIDGTYQATIVIKDKGSHTSTQSTTFTIDNTPPVLILTKPNSTPGDKTISAYGQRLFLEGNVADSTKDTWIEINFYSDPSCSQDSYLTTLETGLIAPTDVNSNNARLAAFSEDLTQDLATEYNRIYGHLSKEGKETIYSTITVYDTAETCTKEDLDQPVGINGNIKGNASQTFYLSKLLAESITKSKQAGGYGLAPIDIYNVLNNSYELKNEARSADAIKIRAELEKETLKKTKAIFELNPENSPYFTVSGLKTIVAQDFKKGDGYTIVNGTQTLEISVFMGSDSIALKDDDNFYVYLLKCNDDGTIPKGYDTEEHRIKLYSKAREEGNGAAKKIYYEIGGKTDHKTTSGAYVFTIPMSQKIWADPDKEGNLGYADVNLEFGQKYRIFVSGSDTENNPVETTDPSGYGFLFTAGGTAPIVDITEPKDTTVWLKKGDTLLVKGTVKSEEGTPRFMVLNNGEVIKEFTLTPSGTSGLYVFDDEIPASAFDQTESLVYSLEFLATRDETKSPYPKSVWYDVIGPEITMGAPSPLIKADSREGVSKDSVNGQIRFSGSITDQFDRFQSASYKVEQGGAVVSGPSLSGNLESNFNFTLDTSLLADKTDATIIITAFDRAGNQTQASYTYYVDQETDKPMITSTSAEIDGGLDETVIEQDRNLFIRGGTLVLSLADDDSIKEAEVALQRKKDDGSFEAINIADAGDNGTKTFYNKYNAPSVISHTIPNIVGIYKATVKVYDNNYTSATATPNNVSEKVFMLRVTGTGPDVTVEYEKEYISTAQAAGENKVTFKVTGTPTDRYKFYVNEELKGQDLASPFDYTLTFNQGTSSAEEITFKITNAQGFTEKYYTPKFDNDKPTVKFTSSPTSDGQTEDASFLFKGEMGDPTSKADKIYLKFINGNAAADITAAKASTDGWGECVCGSASWNFEAVWANISVFSSEGPKTAIAKAVDSAGNVEFATSTFNYDKIKPSIEAVTGNTTTKGQDVTLTISIKDTNPVAPEVIVKNFDGAGNDKTITASTPVSAGSETSWTSSVTIPFASTLTTDKAYTIQVTAKDENGRTSAGHKDVTIIRDSVAPAISFTSPAAASSAFINKSSYKFEGSVTDANEISEATIQLYKNGDTAVDGANSSLNLGNDGSWSHTFYDLEPGLYSVKVYAKDIAGNDNTQTSNPVNMDNTPPVVTLTATGLTNEDGSAISSTTTLVAGTTYYSKSNYVINASVDDLNFEYSDALVTVVSNPTQTLTKSSSDAKKFSFKPQTYEDKLYNYTITVYDKAGNHAEPVTIKVHRDNSGPSVTIKNPSEDITDSTKALDDATYSFRINATDNSGGVGVASLSYAFSQSSSAPAASSAEWVTESFSGGDRNIDMELSAGKTPGTAPYSKLCEGTWYLYAKAIDKSGNTTSSITRRQFPIDKANPSLTANNNLNESGVNPLNTEIKDGGYTISGSVSDTNGLPASGAVKISVDNQAEQNATVNTSTGAWSYKIETGTAAGKLKADEPVVVKVTAYDVAGKKDSKTYTLYYDTKDPELEVAAPVSGEAVASASKEIKGTVSDGGYGIKKLEYKLYKGTGTTSTEIDSGSTEGTSPKVIIKGEQWYISGDGKISLGSDQGALRLVVTATENDNGKTGSEKSGGRVKEEEISFYYDEAAPSLTETGINTTGKTTNTSFTLSGNAADSNALESITISWGTNNSITLTPGQDQSKNWNWSQEFVVGSAASGTNKVADGTNEFTIIAKDIAGKEKTLSRTVVVDTTKPTVGNITVDTAGGTTIGEGDDEEIWYKTTSVPVTVAVSDSGTGSAFSAGISKVEYQAENGSYAPLSKVGDNYSGTVNFSGNGTQTLNLKVTDVAGNESTEKSTTVHIDTTAPSLSARYYKLGTGTAKDVGNIIYVKTSTQITVYGNYDDEQSGINGLSFDYGSPAVTYSTTAIGDSVPSDEDYTISSVTGKETTIKSWMAVFTPSASGAFTVSGSNRTNNPTGSLKVFDVTVDGEAPVVDNVKLIEVKDSGENQAYSDGSKYFVNNTSTGKTFKISGVATDNVGVDSVELLITKDGSTTTTKTATRKGSLGQWYFDGIDLSDWTGTGENSVTGATAKVTVKDKAGNTTEQSLIIKFDITSPATDHKIDDSQKNLEFRIGDAENDNHEADVGSKYSNGSYGSALTMQLRGYFPDNEGGSGINKFYYRTFNNEEVKINPDRDNEEKENGQIFFKDDAALIAYVIAKNTGVFSPIAKETRNVEYNIGPFLDDDNKPLSSVADTVLTNARIRFGGGPTTAKENGNYTVNEKGYVQFRTSVDTNFKTTMKGFVEGKNYLVIVAEDNAGNLGLDTATVAGVEYPCYSLNVDITAPTIPTKQDDTIYTNLEEIDGVVISGTVSDMPNVANGSSGLSKIIITRDGGTGSVEVTNFTTPTDEERAAAKDVDEAYETDTTLKHWEKDVSSLLPSSGMAIISAKVIDNAGFETSLPVANITVDKTGPTVTINSPAANAVVGKTFTISGIANDGNGSGVDTDSGLELWYKVADGDWTKYTSNPTLTGQNWTCDVDASGFVSDGTNTAVSFKVKAKDKSGTGNPGESAELAVTVDIKKPVYDASELRIGGKTLAQMTDSPWFKDSTLEVKGKFTDDGGSGVTKIFYQVDSNSQVELATSNGSFNTNISGFGANSTLKIWAEDAVGNSTSGDKKSYTIKVDGTAPTITSDITGIKYSNGSAAFSVSLKVRDAASGIASVVLSRDGTNTTLPCSLSNGKYTATDISSLLPASGNATIMATATDNAGNTASTVAANILVDITEPGVTLTAPADADTSTSTDASGIQVNGTISLSGTSSDENVISRVVGLLYKNDTSATKPAKQKDLSATAELSTWTVPTGWTKVAATLSNANATTNWTFNDVDTKKLDGTNTIAENSSIWFTVAVQDTAGNIGYSEPLQVYAKQDTDRPTITLSQLTENTYTGTQLNAASVTTLKTKNVYGSVTDDDGTLEKLWYWNGAAAPTTTPNYTTTWVVPTGWNEITINGGSWSIDSTEEDGQTTWYFAVADADKTVFATVGTDTLNLPYIKYAGDAAKVSGTAKGVTFKYDTNPPTADSLYLYRAAAGTTTSASDLADTDAEDADAIEWTQVKNLAFGHNYNKLYAKVVVTEGTGMKALTGSNNAVPTSSPILISYKNSNGTTYSYNYEQIKLVHTDNTNTYTYYLGPITMDTTEQHDFKITVEDAVGNKGYISRSIIVDNEAPTSITEVKPKSTVEISDVFTYRGNVSDNTGGSGVTKVEWYIPKSSETDVSAIAASAWKEASLSAGWEIDFSGDNNLSKIIDYKTNGNTFTIASDYTAYETSSGSAVYSIPVWFKITDAVGNIGYNKENAVRYNPDTDRPSVQITSPAHNKTATISGNSIDYAIMGGTTARISGNADDNEGISEVYLQFDLDDDGKWDNGVATLDGSTALTADLNAIPGASATFIDGCPWAEAADVIKEIKYQNGTSTGYFGIKVSGTKNWSYTLDLSSRELLHITETKTGTEPNVTYTYSGKTIKVRAIAVDNDDSGNGQLVSAPSAVINISVNNDIPLFSNLKLKQIDSSNNVLSEIDYTDGKYLTGEDWYITGDVYAYGGISSANYTGVTDAKSFFTAQVDSEDNISTTMFDMKIPIEPDDSGKWDSTITVFDTNSSGAQPNQQRIIIHIDNDAPTFNDTYTGTNIATYGTAKHYMNSYGARGTLLTPTVKIQDTNGLASIWGKVTDTGSGFDKAVFYFKRFDVNGISNPRIYNPMEQTNNRTNIVSTSSVGEVYINSDGLPALVVESNEDAKMTVSRPEASDNEIQVTLGEGATVSGIAGNKNVRKGGLIKIGGVYRTITDVDYTSGIVTFNPPCDRSFVTAEIIYAMVVDSTGETMTNDTINEEDGDGMQENFSDVSGTVTWNAAIRTSYIPDGPLELHVVAFDTAGNIRDAYTKTGVDNNPLRITSVKLGTDLNGNGSYDDSEFETFYAIKRSNGQFDTTTGADKWELDTKNELGGASYFTAKRGFSAIPEFVGGTGDVYYKFKKSTSPIEQAEAFTYTSPATKPSDDAKLTSQSVNATTGNKNGQLKLDNSTIVTTTNEYDGTNNETVWYNFSFWDSTEASNPGINSSSTVLAAKVTQDLVDDTAPRIVIEPFRWAGEGSAAAGADNTTEVVRKFKYSTVKGNKGYAYTFFYTDEACTVRVTDSTADNADVYTKETVSINSLYNNLSANGHIDLSANLPTDKFTSTTGEYDRDPKVSGQITFSGTAYDNVGLSSLWFSFDGFTPTNYYSTTDKYGDSTTPGKKADVVVATYEENNSTVEVKKDFYQAAYYDPANGWQLASAAIADGWLFTVSEDEGEGYFNQNGHRVRWTLSIDTSKISDTAGTDKKLYMLAVDHNAEDTSVTTKVSPFTTDAVDSQKTADEGTNNVSSYQVDVVPYITGIVRVSPKTSTHRSHKGKYQVVLNEFVKIAGFNLPGKTENAIKLQTTANKGNDNTVKTQITADSATGTSDLTFKAPATSGYIRVVTNNVSSLNNVNSGNSIVNPNYTGDVWTDDIYLNVWKNDEYFYYSNDPISPSMDRIKYNGTNTDVRYRLYGGWATQGSKFYASYPNTTGSGSSGNAPSPASGTNATNKTSQDLKDPPTFYDVVVDGQNRYNILLDCWQGGNDGLGWGRNFVMNRNGVFSRNGTNEVFTNSNSNDLYRVIERMGALKTPENADSSDGLDEIFNQFLNPRITYYDGNAFLSYYDRYAKCLKWAMMGSFDNNNKPSTKYATEGKIIEGEYKATTFKNDDGYTVSSYYRNGGLVVAGYDTLVSGGTSSTLNSGLWSDIAIDTSSELPVIAYYEMTGSTKHLMVATGYKDSTNSDDTTYPINKNNPVITSTTTPTEQGSAWKRQEVPGSADLKLGEYVSIALDGGNNIHIACKGFDEGALYYVYGARSAYGTYTWTTVCVDNNGSPGNWTDIKLTNPSASGAAAGPVISYYDPTNDATEDALKVAYLESTTSNSAEYWDSMTVPCNSAATSNRITLALDVTDGASIASQATTSNNSKLAIGYVSSRFDCVYLRKE